MYGGCVLLDHGLLSCCLVQFGINKHSQIFKDYKLHSHYGLVQFFVAFKKFARPYLFQLHSKLPILLVTVGQRLAHLSNVGQCGSVRFFQVRKVDKALIKNSVTIHQVKNNNIC